MLKQFVISYPTTIKRSNKKLFFVQISLFFLFKRKGIELEKNNNNCLQKLLFSFYQP